MLDVEKFIGGLHEYMGRALSPLAARIRTLEERAPVPGPKGDPGKAADPEAIAALVAEGVAKALPDAVQKALDALLPSIIDKAVAAIPKPQDGKDADPEAIKAMVAEAVAAIPAPKDGKDVDPEVVKAMVAEAVAAIPKPQDGKDVDPEVVKAMVAEAVAAIPTPKDGTDGTSVTLEDVAPLIAEEVSKAAAAIPGPKDGTPGRDAAHIEILPAINSEKSYPRGTYAKHDGGLWRSFESTHGMKGWECIVDGIAAVDVEQVSERRFAVTLRQSSGAEQRKELRLPGMEDRGVYQPDCKQYEKGDTVSWGGSVYIAQKDAPEGKPGDASGDWRLAVKKGRDGRDLRPDEPPAPPKPVRLK